MEYVAKINETSNDTFRYLNFDKISDYTKLAETVDLDKELDKIRTKMELRM